jgi:hypothetical protein
MKKAPALLWNTGNTWNPLPTQCRGGAGGYGHAGIARRFRGCRSTQESRREGSKRAAGGRRRDVAGNICLWPCRKYLLDFLESDGHCVWSGGGGGGGGGGGAFATGMIRG